MPSRTQIDHRGHDPMPRARRRALIPRRGRRGRRRGLRTHTHAMLGARWRLSEAGSAHASRRSRYGRRSMSRHCAKPGCNTMANATLTYDYGNRNAWVERLSDGAASDDARPLRSSRRQPVRPRRAGASKTAASSSRCSASAATSRPDAANWVHIALMGAMTRIRTPLPSVGGIRAGRRAARPRRRRSAGASATPPPASCSPGWSRP